MKQKTYLITGNAGLLGGSLVKWLLLNTNHKIIGIDSMMGGLESNLPPISDRFTFYNLNQGDIKIIDIFKKHTPDIIYLFASYASEGLSPFIKKFIYNNNVVSAMNIINCCIEYGCERLVFTSSMGVYGNGVPPFKETDLPSPIDSYGIGKYAIELELAASAKQFGLNYTIIRPHNCYAGEIANPNIIGDYGVGQNLYDAYRNVLAIWQYNLLNDRPITIFSDGSQMRSFSHMLDIVEPLYIAGIEPKANREIINLGGIKETTILEAAHILKEIAGYGNIVHLEKRHEVKYAWSSFEKSQEILGFEHKTDLYNGLKLMWEWAKLQPKKERFVWPEYEITKGLYEFWKPDFIKNETKI